MKTPAKKRATNGPKGPRTWKRIAKTEFTGYTERGRSLFFGIVDFDGNRATVPVEVGPIRHFSDDIPVRVEVRVTITKDKKGKQ